MSTSLSSSHSRGTWYDEVGERRSSIPYRRGPLDYSPDVLCHCGKKTALWISWSNDNLGRRYFKCYNARYGGCDFLVVHERLADGSPDVVKALKRERADLKDALSDIVIELEMPNKENIGLSYAMEEGRPWVSKKKSEKKHWLFGLFVGCATILPDNL